MQLLSFLFVTVLNLPLCSREKNFVGFDWGFHNRALNKVMGELNETVVENVYIFRKYDKKKL